MLIDTHTHLYADEFDEDRKDVIQNSINEGVTQFYLPAIDSEFHQKMYDLENEFPDNIHLMMGLHPCYVKEDTFLNELQIVENELEKRKFSAIGEIGIDLYWDKSTLNIQQEAFVKQIHLAKKHKLPIVIHSRDSFDEIFEILQQEKSDDLYGIFHCFSGDLEQAKLAIDLGFTLGIGGVVTFKNGKIDTFLHEIPLEKIVLETDSPYLAPVPFRGKRNESKYLKEIALKLCDIYKVPFHEIEKITSENALIIFRN